MENESESEKEKMKHTLRMQSIREWKFCRKKCFEIACETHSESSREEEVTTTVQCVRKKKQREAGEQYWLEVYISIVDLDFNTQ